MERVDKVVGAEDSHPTQKIQINAQLDGDVAVAFNRYYRESGTGTVSAATRSLIVPRPRELGYLSPVAAPTAIEMPLGVDCVSV